MAMNQPMKEMIATPPIPDGQERLATERERDEVARRIRPRALNKPSFDERINGEPPREAGDQVNRFLLCVLVNESSKQIKARAGRDGERLPMSRIVRGVLRSYRLAAMDRGGPLAGSTVDIAGLQQLNETVLKDEMRRFALERVSDSQARLARAERLGDDARIKAERTELEHAIDLRDRIPTFR